MVSFAGASPFSAKFNLNFLNKLISASADTVFRMITFNSWR